MTTCQSRSPWRAGLGVARYGDRIDRGLVGVVPVAAGQPQTLVVLDGHFDVIGTRVDPGVGEFVHAGQRPGLGQPVAQVMAQRGDAGLVGLIGGGILSRVVDDQPQRLAGGRGPDGLKDMAGGEIVDADRQLGADVTEELAERLPPAVRTGSEMDRHAGVHRYQRRVRSGGVGQLRFRRQRQRWVHHCDGRHRAVDEAQLISEVRHRPVVGRQPPRLSITPRILQTLALTG